MITTQSEEFKRLLEQTELSTTQIEDVVRFREFVVEEDAIQNLTRLLSPKDFFEGHVLDVIHLEKSGALRFPALDIGAGMGVPGLLHAIIFRRAAKSNEIAWISSDSERMKADFARRMIEVFSLPAVATHDRAEVYLSSHEVKAVVARAVGPVSRIYGWIKGCSTWNNLILLKGPKWEEEWAEFQKTGQRNQLRIEERYNYTVGEEKKTRIIVRLVRQN